MAFKAYQYAKNKKSHINEIIKFRGLVLHHCTILEKYIEVTIIYSFTYNHDVAKYISTLLLDRMSFDSKISVYEQIMKSQFGEDFKKKCSKLLGELRKVKDDRNIFAHYMLFSQYNGEIPKDIELLSMRNSVDLITYSKEKADQIIKRIIKCREVIELLDNELIDRGKRMLVDESGSSSTN